MEYEQDVLDDIASLMVEIRTRRGLTRTQLSNLAGVDIKTIRSLEQAEHWPKENSRRKILDALGLSRRFMDFFIDGMHDYDKYDDSELAENATKYGIRSEDLIRVFSSGALEQLRMDEGRYADSFPDEEQAEQMAGDFRREQDTTGPRLNAASDAELLAEIAKRFSRTAPPGNVPLPADYYDLAAHPKTDSPGVREHAAGMERGEESQDFPDD